MTVMTNPDGTKVNGKDDMLDIAQALEDLSCDKKRSTVNTNTPMEPIGSKPKKRRRRRHEIARNFRCTMNNCTKSYGSEGALKTHIKNKHIDGHDHKKRERESKTAPWANAVTAGLSPVLLPQLPSVFKSLAGENFPITTRMPPSFLSQDTIPRILSSTQQNSIDIQPNKDQLPSFNSLITSL